MALSSADVAGQLRLERQHLVKANQNIEEGRKRLVDQEQRLATLLSSRHDTHQAERFIDLLKRILAQWERHRFLIEQRVGHLEAQFDRPSPGA